MTENQERILEQVNGYLADKREVQESRLTTAEGAEIYLETDEEKQLMLELKARLVQIKDAKIDILLRQLAQK